METMVVKELKYDGDRILLYGDDSRYHVIAKPDAEIEIGDTIEYEPYGINFGWFKSVIIKAKRKRQLHDNPQ